MYNAPDSDAAIIDSDGNHTADFNQTIVNASTFTQTIAAVSAATAAATGDTIDLTFTENIYTDGVLVNDAGVTQEQRNALASGMVIEVNGRLLDSSKFTLTAVAADQLRLTINDVGNDVSSQDAINVSYNAPESAAALVDADGNLTLDFTQSITNNSTQDFEGPIFLADNAATTVSASGTTIDLKFSENLGAIR